MPSKPVNLFSKTTGVNFVEDPLRLSYDFANGVCELASASNIDVSDSGTLQSRDGLTRRIAGSTTNICCSGSFCLAVIADDLVFIDAHLATSTLFSGVGTVYFAALPGRIYYSFLGSKGFVEADGAPQAWAFTPSIDGDNRELVGPPSNSTHMCYHLGSMYVASSDVLWRSMPYAPNIFDMASGWFDMAPLDLFSYDNVLYVVTSSGLFALIGAGNEQYEIFITDVVVLPGTFALVDKFGSSNQRGVLVATERGVAFVAGADITFIGTERLNQLPNMRGSAYISKTHYYCSLS